MEIFINNAILHIVENNRELAVFSENELDIDSDMVTEFLTKHIKKLNNNPSVKEATFNKESQIYKSINQFKTKEINFKEFAKNICKPLADIMINYKEIPPAAIIVAQIDIKNNQFLAILKLNHRSYYTHSTEGGQNHIVKSLQGLPFDSGKVEEAVLIPLENMLLKLIEKPYILDGKETNYFSEVFLQASAEMSKKEVIAIINEAIENIAAQSTDMLLGAKIQLALIEDALENEGAVRLESVANIALSQDENLKEHFINFVRENGLTKDLFLGEKYCMRQFGNYKLKGAGGIELKFPVGVVDDTNVIAANLDDGRLTVGLYNV